MNKSAKVFIASLIACILAATPVFSGCGGDTKTNNHNYEISNTDPIPNVGKVIHEAIVTESNLDFKVEDLGLRISVSPLCLNKPESKITIKEVKIKDQESDTKWQAYDIALDSKQPFDGVIKVELPYSDSEIIDGFSPSQCLSGVYFNEEDSIWEQLPTEFNTSKKTMTISTTHLTVLGKKIVNPNKIKSGTADIGHKNIKDFDPNGPNFPPFYTMNQGTPNEYITHFDNQYIFENFMDYFNPVIFKNIEKLSSEEQGEEFFKSTLSFMSSLEGSSEHGLSVAKIAPDLIKGVTSSKWRSFHGKLGHIGAVLSVLQLANDASEGTDENKTIFTFMKNMVYYQGAAAATFVFGKAALPVALVFLAGCYLFEWNVSSFEDLIFGSLSSENEFLHKRFIIAYNKFYKRYKTNKSGGGRKHYYWWGKKIDELSKTALEGATFRSDYTKNFQDLLIKEIDKHNLEFFDLDDNAIENLLLAETEGAVYGSKERPHIPKGVSIYAGAKNEIGLIPYHLKGDNIPKDLEEGWNGILHALRVNSKEPEYFPHEMAELGPEKNKTFAFYYTGELREQIKTNSGFMKQFLKIKRGKVIEEIINPILEHKRERFETETKERAIKHFGDLKDYYNRRPTFKVFDPNAEKGKSSFAGCILVPKFADPKTVSDIEDWFITLGKDGTGEMKMNMVAYFQQLLFEKFEIYSGKDKNKIKSGKAKSIGTVSFITDDYNPVIEVILPSNDSLAGVYFETIDFAKEVRYNQIKTFAIARTMGDELTATKTKADDLTVRFDVDQSNNMTVNFNTSVTLFGTSEDGSFEGFWYLKSNVESDRFQIGGNTVDIEIPAAINISEQRIYGDGKTENIDHGTSPTTFKIVGEFKLDNGINEYVFTGKLLIPESYYFFDEKYGKNHEVELILSVDGNRAGRGRTPLDFDEFNDPKYHQPLPEKDENKMLSGANPFGGYDPTKTDDDEIPGIKGGNPFGGQSINP